MLPQIMSRLTHTSAFLRTQKLTVQCQYREFLKMNLFNPEVKKCKDKKKIIFCLLTKQNNIIPKTKYSACITHDGY